MDSIDKFRKVYVELGVYVELASTHLAVGAFTKHKLGGGGHD